MNPRKTNFIQKNIPGLNLKFYGIYANLKIGVVEGK